MPRRRYRWRHPFHDQYILSTNTAVQVHNEGDLAHRFSRPWRVTIGESVVGWFRTFAQAEEAIPAEAVHANRSPSPTGG